MLPYLVSLLEGVEKSFASREATRRMREPQLTVLRTLPTVDTTTLLARNMQEAVTLRGSPDDQVIFLSDGDEVAHWCNLFGVAPELLAHAVRCVGPSAVHVKRYLRDRAPKRADVA